MHVPSNLSYQTDFIFHRFQGEVMEHANYWVVRTPNNPTYWFGNFLLFKTAPAGHRILDRWLELHRQEFGDNLNHRVFGWDEEREGDVGSFLEAGFQTSHGIELALDTMPGTSKLNPAITVRPIIATTDWEAVAAQQILVDRVDFDYPEDGGEFRRRQLKGFRKMSEAGRGHWWGAFIGPELVGNMGLFFDEQNRVGRFQNVSTSPDHRRRRVCTTLLHHIVQHAFEKVGARQLVICTGADDDNAAIPTYRNFGFKDAGRSYAVVRRPRKSEA